MCVYTLTSASVAHESHDGSKRSLYSIVELLWSILLDEAKRFTQVLRHGHGDPTSSFLERQKYARKALARTQYKLHGVETSNDDCVVAMSCTPKEVLMTTSSGDEILVPRSYAAIARIAFAYLSPSFRRCIREDFLAEHGIRLVRDRSPGSAGYMARAIARACLPDLPPLAAVKVASCFASAFDNLVSSGCPLAGEMAKSDKMKGLCRHVQLHVNVSDGIPSAALTEGMAAVVLHTTCHKTVEVFKVTEEGGVEHGREFLEGFRFQRLQSSGDWVIVPGDDLLHGNWKAGDGCIVLYANRHGLHEGIVLAEHHKLDTISSTSSSSI